MTSEIKPDGDATKARLMHPAYLSIESVVRAFTDDPEQTEARAHLIVRRLYTDGLLKDASDHKGMIILEKAAK